AGGGGDGAVQTHASSIEELASVLEVDLPHISKQHGQQANASNASTANQAHNLQMLQFVQTQRDRYKEKLTMAESQVLSLQQQLAAIQSKYTILESDNVQLYGRIKFLQSYKRAGRDDGGYNSYNGYSGGFAEEGRVSESGEVEVKYSLLYEQRMNPFSEFASFEKQRKLRELSVADRIVLNTTMAIVSNHTGRK
ncbi:hypothetical protein EON64_18630, partial [archaeon]